MVVLFNNNICIVIVDCKCKYMVMLLEEDIFMFYVGDLVFLMEDVKNFCFIVDEYCRFLEENNRFVEEKWVLMNLLILMN